jgi:Flp pilus assembly protein TadG
MNELQSEFAIAKQTEIPHARPGVLRRMRGVYRCLRRIGVRPDPMRREDGGALIEMALVFPMLMLIMTAIFAFGIGLNNYLEMTNAVSIAGRQMAISRGQTTDPCAQAVTTIESAAPQLKPANLTFSFVLNGTPYSGTSCSSSNTTTGAAGNLVQGASAQVTITYPCNLAVYGKNYAPTCSLVAQTTELVQ